MRQSIISSSAASATKGAIFPLGVFHGNGVATTASFQNIPQTYQDLMIHVYAQSNNLNTTISARFNNDSTSNYSYYYINATGKIKIQLYLSLLMALINIPLSIYIAKSLDFGVVGVMISTIICIAPGIVFSRIQFKKIISETAKGIWNQ